MPQYPQGDERDRNIPPVTDQEDTGGEDTTLEDSDQAGDPELANMQVAENDDGSADITFQDELPADPTSFDANLAELLDPEILHSMGSTLVELVEKDKESREKRDKQYEEGIRRSGLGDDAPGGAQFNGASKVVHPMLAEGCVDFAARAIKELFPPSGPVKTALHGVEDSARLDVANRKARFMNWQLTKEVSEYRAELEQMLTQLPMGGSQFQKFWYDEKLKRIRCEFVPIDDIFLPYAVTDFYTAHRKTHVLHLTQYEFEERVRTGMYIDPKMDLSSSILPDQTATAIASDKVEGKEGDAYNEDGIRDLYEIYTYQRIDQDDASEGDYAPYIITVDAYSEKVLSVYRNWEQTDPRLVALDWMVEWKFIPWRGAYAIGIPHLIGGLSGAATGALRALLDSAHINNSQTLVKLKGGRMSGQNLEIDPTQVAEIEGPAGTDDIRKLMMAMPYNPPSTVLFQLLDWLTAAGKGVIATAEESIKDVGDRTPVGTTMAMIEQGSHTYSAIHARLHYSQAKALEIVARLNKTYMDDQRTIEELGNLVISREEFASTNDIQPVSDPNIFSESQRYAQMQGAAQVAQMFPQEKWNTNALARGMLERLRIPNVDELLPKPPEPQNMNPAAENVAAMHGQPVLALPKQNHLAHIQVHLAYCLNPIFGTPVYGQKLFPTMVRHLGEHLGFMYADMVEQYTHFQQLVAQMPTKEMEARIAQVNDQILMNMQQQLAPIMPKIQQVAQMAQQFQPQPPMDPAVQVTRDLGMADIQRKTQRDKAELDMLQKEKLQILPQIEQSKRDVELLKNLRDNIQKHITELAKNQGDNETNQWVAALKVGNEQMMAMIEQKLQAEENQLNRDHDFDKTAFLTTNGPTGEDENAFSATDQGQPQQKQPQQPSANDAKLDQVLQAISALHQHVTAPKQVVRDHMGRVIGIHPVIPNGVNNGNIQ